MNRPRATEEHVSNRCKPTARNCACVSRGAISCLLFLLCAGLVSAQALTGSIAGTVTDTTGAPIPAVGVTVTSPALITGSKSMMTDSNGYYKFLELPPGTYDVKFEKHSFKSLVTQGIVINSAVQVTTDARLELGEVTQEMTVNAQTATIDTEHVTAQVVTGQQVMEGIPTGRSPWAVTNTVPSVTSSTHDVGGSSGTQEPSLVVHGSTNADKKYMIDGVNVNWPGAGGGSTAMYYDQGMFQEVNYQVGALPADISQGGVFMNMVTKDGGNQIHGSVFLNGASQGMQSNNVSGVLANELLLNIPASQRNNPNLILGNPITETYDYNADVGGPLIKDKLWWFTSFRAWTVNSLVAGAFNPNGSQAINDNLITNEMAKFSWQLNEKNKISWMYSRNQKNRYHRRNTPPFFVSDQAAWLQNQPGYDGTVKWTYTPSSKWVLDSGVALMHIKYPQRYESSVSRNDISVTDTSLSTEVNAAAYNYINPTYRLAADSSASYITSGFGGQHSIKFGVQFSHDYYAQLYTANGDLQGVMINGVPSTATIYNTPINQQTNNLNILGLYVEDSWTILRRLTLNLGVRWEYMLGTIPAQTSPAGTFVGARNYSEIDNVPNWKNWTPRLGFAYDPTGHGKTVIKGSASKYVQGVAMNLITAVNPLGFSTASVPWICSGPACINGPTPSQLNLSQFNGFVGGATTHLDPDIKRPYSWEESLGIQQQVPGGIILSVTGWYRSTFDQIGRENLAVPASDYTQVAITNPVSGTPLIVYNQLPSTKGQVNYLLTNSRVLNTEYRGLDVNFNRQMTKHWLLLGGLTLGRYRGAWTGDLNTALDDLNNPNYSYNRLGENAFDSPVQFKIAGTYKLPWGFQISGDFQHSTGYPIEELYTVTSAALPKGNTLTQVSQPIVVAPFGPNRLPNVNLLDARFSKIFAFGERWRVQPELDVYNFTNSSAVQAVNISVNNPALALNPTTILPPRLLKVGLKVDF